MNGNLCGSGSASARAASERLSLVVVEALEARRLLSGGQLDATFGTGGVATDNTRGFTYNIAFQGDGKMLAADWNAFGVTRYGVNGNRDLSFGLSGDAR